MYGRSSKLFAHFSANTTATLHMLNPEFPDFRIFTCKSVTIIGKRMREAGAVEIQGNTQFFSQVDPTLEVLDLNLITFNFHTTKIAIDSMQVKSLFSR